MLNKSINFINSEMYIIEMMSSFGNGIAFLFSKDLLLKVLKESLMDLLNSLLKIQCKATLSNPVNITSSQASASDRSLLFSVLFSFVCCTHETVSERPVGGPWACHLILTQG